MPKTKTYQDAFLDEVRDTYDAEKQIVKALPGMIRSATSEELRAGLEEHLGETRVQVERLERVFEMLGEKPRGKHCAGMAGILEEGKSVLEEEFDEATTDACIIASGQRVEHYEFAAYGTLVAWARAIGHDEAVALLEETLEEEKAADEKLSAVAESINAEAASNGEGDDEGTDEGEDEAIDEEEPTEKKGAKTSSGNGAQRRAPAQAKRR